MSRRQLMREMDANEVFKWMAYEMSVDPERHKVYMVAVQEEQAKNMTDEERAEAIKRNINMAME